MSSYNLQARFPQKKIGALRLGLDSTKNVSHLSLPLIF